MHDGLQPGTRHQTDISVEELHRRLAAFEAAAPEVVERVNQCEQELREQEEEDKKQRELERIRPNIPEVLFQILFQIHQPLNVSNIILGQYEEKVPYLNYYDEW